MQPSLAKQTWRGEGTADAARRVLGRLSVDGRQAQLLWESDSAAASPATPERARASTRPRGRPPRTR
jgi:hypothetical protein